MHLLPLLLLAAFLLLPGSVLADGPAGGEAPEGSQPMFTRATILGDPDTAWPTAIHPVSGLRAAAFPMRNFGLWAQGLGFALDGHSAIYDIEGGASLRLNDGVHLTASYRLMGVGQGLDPNLQGMVEDAGIAAPFLGLAFDF